MGNLLAETDLKEISLPDIQIPLHFKRFILGSEFFSGIQPMAVLPCLMGIYCGTRDSSLSVNPCKG